jgi:hypothetical protein
MKWKRGIDTGLFHIFAECSSQKLVRLPRKVSVFSRRFLLDVLHLYRGGLSDIVFGVVAGAIFRIHSSLFPLSAVLVYMH